MIKLTKCLVSNPFSSHHKMADDYEVCCYALLLLFNGALRTVPTNGKYFFPDNDYVRQVDHIGGY